jgi:hypothetical protein
MVSAEYHAMPRRWAFGLKESDFVDAAGNQMSPWSMTAGHIWSNEQAPTSRSGSSPSRTWTNFHNTMKVLVQTRRR